MKQIIHVNRHKLSANRKNGVDEPAITVKNYKENKYGHTVVIYGQDGKEAAKIVQRMNKPLSCGAVVYIVTENKVEVDPIESMLNGTAA